MKNKMFTVALLVFGIGTIMILGTSYSLIMSNIVSKETYGFDVANFDVSFNDDTKLTISGIPMSDDEAIKKSKEFIFSVDNNSDFDINYRLDILENNGMNIGDVVHYVYSVNGNEYSDVLSLKDYTIKQNKTLKNNASDIYKIKIWLSLDADETFMNKKLSATINLNATQNEYKYATTVIEKLGNNNQDSVIKVDNGFRYSKKDAPNYVWFNCMDGFTTGEDYCEKWRIIGSFYNKSEKSHEEYLSLKIVRDTSFEEIPYNSEENNNYDNSYINSYANGYFYDKLNSHAQKLILKAKWNIGDVKSKTYQDVLKEEKANTYFANVALPNISDYLYLQNESFLSNNLMFLNKTNGQVNVLNEMVTSGENENNYSFVPCLYLRGDVSIVSGNGSIDSPYELVIKYPLNY